VFTEIWYSPKYNEIVLREFISKSYVRLAALEYSDDFNIKIWEKYERQTWFYIGHYRTSKDEL